MKLKKDTTVGNVFAIGWTWFLDAAIGGYVNAQIVYLIQDEDYFDVEEEREGRTSSNIYAIALAFSMLWSFFAGYIYDRFQRKMPCFLAALIGASLVALCPQTSPSIFWLTVVRVVIMIAQCQIVVCPIVMDYIK